MPIRYFERQSESATQQFCRIVVESQRLTVQSGAIGTEGETVETTFDTVEACATAADREVDKYVNRGYDEVLPGSETGNCPSPRLTLQLNPIWSFCISPDGKAFTCCARKQGYSAIETWSTQTGELVRVDDYRFEGYGWKTNIYQNSILIACKMIGESVGSQRQSDTAQLWHGWSQKPLAEIRCDGFDIHQMVASRSVIVGHDGEHTVRVWDVFTGAVLHSFETAPGVCCVTTSGDGEWIAAGGGSNQQGWVSIWNRETGSHRCTLTMNQEADSSVTSIALNSDGSILVASLRRANLQVWDVASGTLRHTLYSYYSPRKFKPIRLSPDNQSVYTIYGSKNIQRWHLLTGNPIQRLVNVPNLNDFAITPFNDTQLLTESAGYGSTVRIWDLPRLSYPTHSLPTPPNLEDEMRRFAEIARSPQTSAFIKQCANRYFQRSSSEYGYMQDFILWAQKRGVLFSLEAVRRSPFWGVLANAIHAKKNKDYLEYRKNYEHVPF